MVKTFIHELTHWISKSYDFVTLGSFPDNGGYTINFNGAYRLASSGIAKKLTPDEAEVFEIRRQLQEGLSTHWRKNMYHWQALNNADTLTVAILALAAVPEGYAWFSMSQRMLFIQPLFLSGCYVEQHPTPVLLSPRLSLSKISRGSKPKKGFMFGEHPKENPRGESSTAQVAAGPCSPGSNSGGSSGSSSSGNSWESRSPPQLSPPLAANIGERCAALTAAAATSEPPGSSSAAMARGGRGGRSFTALFGRQGKR